MIMKKIGINADLHHSRNEDEIKTVESFDGEKELQEEKERDKKRKVSAYKSLQFSKFEKDELLDNALENIPQHLKKIKKNSKVKLVPKINISKIAQPTKNKENTRTNSVQVLGTVGKLDHYY